MLFVFPSNINRFLFPDEYKKFDLYWRYYIGYFGSERKQEFSRVVKNLGDDKLNKLVRKHGTIPKFKFKLKAHGELIQNLDKRRPQVLIDVTLVEITRDDTFTYDLDLVSSFPDLDYTSGLIPPLKTICKVLFYRIMILHYVANSRTLFNSSCFSFLSASFIMRASNCDGLLAETLSDHD